MNKFKLTLDFNLQSRTEPEATLIIKWDCIKDIHLSVANRKARNRRSFYQKRHHLSGSLATRHRDPELNTLNLPIEEHYNLFLQKNPDRAESPILAFTISDLTANLLRPHYIPLPSSNTNLFYLEEEPLDKASYTLLVAYKKEKDKPRLNIYSNVNLIPNSIHFLPSNILSKEEDQLIWWAACPPILIDENFKVENYTILDYDLRHIFENKEIIKHIYPYFTNWESWCDKIKKALKGLNSFPKGYHSVLGITPDNLIIIHRFSTIPDIAKQLKELGATHAVLLDSGGSCALWANWVNGNRGGILASHFNFRPLRGAVVFLVLEGNRYPRNMGK